MGEDHWEGELGCRGSPEGERGPGLIWGLPRPELHPREEEIPITQTAKIRGDSSHLGETNQAAGAAGRDQCRNGGGGEEEVTK